ncbi:MAG: hypothetical protein ABL921_16230 [Pirellula sp.]
MVPNRVLLALDPVLFSSQRNPNSAGNNDVWLFSTDKYKRTFLIRNDPFDWLVFLFSNGLLSEKNHPHAVTQIDDCWSDQPALADNLRKLALVTNSSGGEHSVLANAHVVRRSTSQVALCIPCDTACNVATLLLEHGHPPSSVSMDWQHQIDAFTTSARASGKTSPTETFVTEDGILIPLSKTLQSWTSTIGLQPTLVNASDNSADNSADNQTEPVEWPWSNNRSVAIAPTMDLSSDGPWPAVAWLSVEPNASSRTAYGTQRQSSTWSRRSAPRLNMSWPRRSAPRLIMSWPRRSAPRQFMLWPLVGGGVVGCLLLLSGIYFMSSTPLAEREASTTVERSQTLASKLPSTTDASEDDGAKLLDANETIAELTTLDSLTTLDMAPSEPSEVESIDSLLSQLGSNAQNKFSLSSTTLDSIIGDSLARRDSDRLKTELESDPVNRLGTEEPTNPNEPGPGTSVLSVDSSPIDRSIRLTSATDRLRIPMGQKVTAKRCRCEIELSVHKRLVVEPQGQAVLEGATSASWKIALEDEEPELVLEVASKPSSHWQLIVSVALKESPGSVPILIAPRDTQMVGNRLVEYHRWLGNSIGLLQNAKANRRPRTGIDFVGEIKKAERQQREVEKAIERWKVVERLSHFFFDDHELRLKLSANSQE